MNEEEVNIDTDNNNMNEEEVNIDTDNNYMIHY
jgi:hypothetical protein